MMLKLGRPAVLGPRVQKLRLPYSCAQPGDVCQVAGWGTTTAKKGKSWGCEASSSGRRAGAGTPGSEGGGGGWALPGVSSPRPL
jgi:hypothetical protein